MDNEQNNQGEEKIKHRQHRGRITGIAAGAAYMLEAITGLVSRRRKCSQV